jgi:hypothetical protein
MTRTARLIGGSLLALLVLTLGFSVYAQGKRPYRDGSVWNIAFIRMKPGMESAYLTYVAGEWKKEQEAMKKAGYILSYKVIGTEAHGATDFNLMLMTEFKDLASMEANAQKAEALGTELGGGDQKIQQGYKERLEIREVLADRLGREIVLEPRP